MRMFRNLRGLLLSVALLIAATAANASFLIEPHIGYNLSGTGDSPGIEYEYNGPQFGLRTGVQSLGVMGGLTFNKSSYDLEAKATGSTVTTDVDRTELGAFVGYNLPIMFRFWGAYYFSSKGEVSNGEYHGNTKELGVGFTALPLLSINLAYRMTTYDEFENNAGTTTSLGNNEIDANEIVLSVSLPLTL
jgi:hypothetical protein